MSAAVSLSLDAAPSVTTARPRPPRFARAWTAHEDATLAMSWGVHTVHAIAKSLDRTPRAIYRRANELELGLGAPQGFEHISAAARRAGYDHETLLRILHWAHVHIRPAAAHPDYANHTRIVESADVDAAVARWCETECLNWAARRHGMSWDVLRRIVLAAHDRGEITLDVRAAAKHWRIPSKEIDAAVASHGARESWESAAKRSGVSIPTIRTWMKAAGFEPQVTPRWRPVVRADVDRVVAERRTASSKAFRIKQQSEGATA